MPIARYLLWGGEPLPRPALPASQPRLLTLDVTLLRQYEGRYRLESGGELNVARREGHLLVDQVGEGILTVFAFARDEFDANTENAQIVFNRDVAGRVVGLTLRTESAAQTATRLSPPP